MVLEQAWAVLKGTKKPRGDEDDDSPNEDFFEDDYTPQVPPVENQRDIRGSEMGETEFMRTGNPADYDQDADGEYLTHSDWKFALDGMMSAAGTMEAIPTFGRVQDLLAPAIQLMMTLEPEGGGI